MNLILFDCDGTLVDSQYLIVQAMTNAFEKHQTKPPPRQDMLSVVGLSLPLAIEVLEPNKAKALEISNSFKAEYNLLLSDQKREPLYPFVKEVITALAKEKNVTLGVATGKSMRGLKHVLAFHELSDHFKTLQTADNAPSKPNPAMIHQALNETGCDIENTIMIGDTTFDIEMGLRAGAKTIAVTWGYHARQDLINAGAHYIVDDYHDLHQQIRKLLIDSSEYKTK